MEDAGRREEERGPRVLHGLDEGRAFHDEIYVGGVCDRPGRFSGKHDGEQDDQHVDQADEAEQAAVFIEQFSLQCTQ